MCKPPATRTVWLPVTIKNKGEMEIRWRDSWDLSVFGNRSRGRAVLPALPSRAVPFTDPLTEKKIKSPGDWSHSAPDSAHTA